MGDKSHILIDLHSRHATEALAILRGMSRSLKVTKAEIVTSGPVHIRYTKDHQSLFEIFHTLADLSNLSTLSIDLDFAIDLPIQALLTLFRRETNQLVNLHLHNLQIAAQGPEDLQELQSLLEENTCLESVKIKGCFGTKAIAALVSSPPSLTHIDLDRTSLPLWKRDACSMLSKLVQSTHLRSLSLKDIPNFENDHIQTLALELSLGKRSLKELKITSNVLGHGSAELITKMLHFNDSIEKFVLHLDCEQVGYFLADALLVNTSLRCIDLRLYGDEEVSGNCISIARALRNCNTSGVGCPSSLRKMRLCFEVGPKHIESNVLSEFDTMLETNETLDKIILETNSKRYPLPKHMRMKLALNRSRIAKLLRSEAKDENMTANVYDGLVEAVISEKSNLNVVFHILTQEPMLCVNASMNAGPINSQQRPHHRQQAWVQTAETFTTAPAYKFPLKHTKSFEEQFFKKLPIPSRAPKLTRKVMSFFAPSA